MCGPPRVIETATSLEWGFTDAAANSCQLVRLRHRSYLPDKDSLPGVALCACTLQAELYATMAQEQGLSYVDFGSLATVSSMDGVHFPQDAQAVLAQGCAAAVVEALV